MTLGNSVKTCFSKYFTFKGRASRSEFWWFFLFVCILNSVIQRINVEAGWLFWFVTAFPCISSAARRLHDSNRSHLWMLIPIINVVFFLLPGTPGNNEYGPEPVE